MTDIQHLRVFVSAFRNKGFSRASKELNIRQPTISNHIKALEDEFNCKLFERLNRTMIPTKEAEVLYSRSVDLIERINILKETMGEIRKDLTGKLVIEASEIPGVYLLPRIMSEFRKKNPGISFRTVISDCRTIVDSMAKHEIVMGIVETKLDNRRMKYMPFAEDELVAVAAPSLVKSSRMSLRDLMKLPIVSREEESEARREMGKFLEGKGVSPDSVKITGAFGSVAAVKQALKAGIGVSILPKFSVADELGICVLKKIELTDIAMRQQYYIVTHKNRSLPRPYSAFLAHIIAAPTIGCKL